MGVGLRHRVRRFDLARRTTRRRELRQPEIENLGVSAFGYKNIRWLDIAMDDALDVGSIQSIRNFNGQCEQHLCLDRVSIDAMLQRNAFQQLHGDEGSPLSFIDFVDRADVRVIQRGRGPGFPLKSAKGLYIVREFLGKEL